MATLLENRYTYWAKSGGANPAYSDQNPDTQGRLSVSYELNAAKTAYKLTIKYYVLSFDYQPGSWLGKVSVNCKVNGSSIGTLTSSDLYHTAEGGTKQTHSLGTKTVTIPINDDGTCSFSYSCTLTPSYGSTRKFSVSHSLPTVNVASTITSDATSGANKEFGKAVTFTITRPNTSVTHTLTYKVGDTTYTIGSGITTSKSYTFPTSLINSFPNNETASIVVTCTSSNGVASTTTVYLTVPSSYVPSCSLVISDVGNVPSSWGIWLKTISKIKGVITASGTAGSTIKSYSTSANGSSYTSSTFTTAVLKNKGSQTIKTTVTDSRGRSSSDSETINVVDYFVPSLSSYSVVRCLEDGTEDNEGTYGKVKCKYSIAPINNGTSDLNTKSLVVKYGDETKTFALSSYSGTLEAAEYFSGLSNASGHNFEFYIIDYFNPNGILYNFTMTPSFTTVSKLAGGKGITFGQVATQEGFHSYMDAFFHGKVEGEGIVNYIYPVGSVYVSNTNTNPSELFGGTWELVDKEFKTLNISDDSGTYFTKNDTNASAYRLYAVRNKKGIKGQLNVTTAVALGEDNVVLGVLNFEKLGISRLYYTPSTMIGGTDGGNGVIMYSIHYTNGNVTSNDVVTKTSGGTIASGQSCYFHFDLEMPSAYMLDDACDKFYWKRTA